MIEAKKYNFFCDAGFKMLKPSKVVLMISSSFVWEMHVMQNAICPSTDFQ